MQQVLRLVFEKLIELGSVRQVFLGFRREGVLLPGLSMDDPTGPRYLLEAGAVWPHSEKELSNPVYAGAYAFGKTEVANNCGFSGRARKSEGHRKPRESWEGLDPGASSRLHFLGAVRTESGCC